MTTAFCDLFRSSYGISPMLDKCTIIGTLSDDEQRQAAAGSLLPYDDRA